MKIRRTIKAGKLILEAYVLAKSGKTKNAGRLFVKAIRGTAADPLLDGLAKSIKDIESAEDEDLLDETEEEVEVVNDDEEELEAEDLDNDNDDDDDDGIEEEEEEEVEIPESVAKVLQLKY